MQPKVSIIIPCYNKVKWIGNTFNSVLAQTWDNIELILVNDGSTDGTREVISEYEPKFKERGFDVIIVDKKNQGLAAAVYNGLQRHTGKFVCQLDADDELDTKYVSTMAGELNENSDYEWAACDGYDINENSTVYITSFPIGCEDLKIEDWILSKIRRSICIYMIRSDYLNRCNVTKAFYTERDANQEQQIVFHLMAGKGKLKYFRMPLHRKLSYEYETHRSYTGSYKRIVSYFMGRYNAACSTIEYLNVDEKEKHKLKMLVNLNLPIEIILLSKNYEVEPQKYAEWKDKLVNLMESYFTPSKDRINIERIIDNIELLRIALGDYFIGVRPKRFNKLDGRIIAWGALGYNASKYLPYLKDSKFEPTELWDIAGDGVKVKKPNIESLSENDIVLILPNQYEEISNSLKAIKFENFLTMNDIQKYAAASVFPQFYDDSITSA
jgi:glycosyltransferase involved in cell wall biosynthesis